jgi:MOB kinase activator 1
LSIVDIFDQLSILFAPVAASCTKKSCPEMTAGPGFKYYWQDDVKYKKPTSLPAHEYIQNVMDWAQRLIHDESYFPADASVPFPKDFMDVAKKILSRLFRVYAHCYHHHIEHFQKANAEAHLNTSLQHFIYFVREFDLVPLDQLAPLGPLIEQLTQKADH